MPKKKTFQEKLADALIRGGNNADEAKQMAKRYSADIQRIYAGQHLTPKEAAGIARSFNVADAGNKYGYVKYGNVST